MAVDVPGLRPQVISIRTAATIDEYLRFRHVVRNVYAFELSYHRIERLASELQSAFQAARGELLAFAAFLEGLAQKD